MILNVNEKTVVGVKLYSQLVRLLLDLHGQVVCHILKRRDLAEYLLSRNVCQLWNGCKRNVA